MKCPTLLCTHNGVGAFKTVPTIYTQTLAATGLTEYNILHIAGAPNDGWGARNAGEWIVDVFVFSCYSY